MVENFKKKAHNAAHRGAREQALHLLLHVFRHPDDLTPLPVLAAGLFPGDCADGRDLRLMTELVCGVLRRRGFLDAVLAGRLRRPGALSGQLRMLLRLGAYELLFLDGVPARATVSEMAALGTRLFGRGMGGLVNAVLRGVAEEASARGAEFAGRRDALREGGITSAELLAETASLPDFLAEDWLAAFDPGTACRLALGAMDPPVPSWRVNMGRPGAEALRAEWTGMGFAPVGKCGFSGGTGLSAACGGEQERARLEALEASGAISRQGSSSQLLAEEIAGWLAERGTMDLPLWDACCGRGGKSCALLEKGVNVVLASDPSEPRLEFFRNDVRRLGIRGPEIMAAPAQSVPGTFAHVLLDAPCSGTGTLGRNPELRVRLSRERMDAAARLQKELLDSAWTHVAKGGALFYATCAASRSENEAMAGAFLDAHRGDASLERMHFLVPGERGGDAMFLAVFSRA